MRRMIDDALTIGLAAALKVPLTAHTSSCADARHHWQLTSLSDRLGDGAVGNALGEDGNLR